MTMTSETGATEPVSPRRHTMSEAGAWMIGILLPPYSADPKTKA